MVSIFECSKIRLQMQGEAAKIEGAIPKGAVHIIRQLGILGLYKGATACLLRDIPFSAIYFTTYSHLRKDVFHEGYNGKQLSFLETLGAAGIAYVLYFFCGWQQSDFFVAAACLRPIFQLLLVRISTSRARFDDLMMGAPFQMS